MLGLLHRLRQRDPLPPRLVRYPARSPCAENVSGSKPAMAQRRLTIRSTAA
jgi:hypothetical protein